MDQLLQKVKINDTTFKNYLVRIVARNLSAITEPCELLNLKKHYYEMLRMTGISERDIKDFTKRRWTHRKSAPFKIILEPIANFYVFLIQYFLRKKNMVAYRYMVNFFVLRYYSNTIHKAFPKYCNKDAFKYTLEKIAKTHLFVREKTIGNSLMHISGDMIRHWTKGLAQNENEAIYRFMVDTRTRVQQSVRSFAEAYYRTMEQGTGFQSDEKDDSQKSLKALNVDSSQKVAEKFTKKIVVYRHVDRKAQEEARSLSKIKASIATQISSKLTNIKFSDNLNIIYKLYLKDIKSVNDICGKGYFVYIKKKMSMRRTIEKIYLKQQINILVLRLIKEFDYQKQYNKLTKQTQYLINLYLAYYLTMLLRNSVCT